MQTPYFIPDETFLKSLILAKKTGVDVKVMIPAKPDKRTVYYVTLSFIKELLDAGIEVYLYNGFLHAKTLLVDDLCHFRNEISEENSEVPFIYVHLMNVPDMFEPRIVPFDLLILMLEQMYIFHDLHITKR